MTMKNARTHSQARAARATHDPQALAKAVLTALAAAALALAFFGQQALAQDDEDDQQDRQFSSEIGQIVLEAQELFDEEDTRGGLAKLNEALSEDPSPFEQSVIYQLRGQANYQLENVAQAIQDWRAAINTGMLDQAAVSGLQVNIGQLLIISERLDEGTQVLEQWLRNNEPKENILMMLASAYAQMERYRDALPHAEAAFEMANPKERKHFDLLNFLYTQLNMPERQADILRQMLARWPEDKNLWNGWVSMLANGGRNDEAFEVNKIMYLNGMLETENDVVRLAQYYSFYEVPYRGAQVLEREINAGRVERTQNNLELLINLWRQSREFDEAIPALRNAAERATNGQLYEQLCEAQYNEALYEDAERACLNALDKGGLNRPGDVWVLIGNSRYEQEDLDGAEEAFRRGAQFSSSRSTANGWLRFISDEKSAAERRREFQETMKREECIITITRIRRDDVLGNRDGVSSIPEDCQEYEQYVDL